MAVETYWLKTIEDAVVIAKTLRQSWFRGHNKIYNELTPTIFRKEYRDSMVPYGPNIEAFFIDPTFRTSHKIIQEIAYD